MKIITDEKDITPMLIEEILHQTISLEQVAVKEIKINKPQSTTTSPLRFIKVKYSKESPKTAPKRLFLKMSNLNFPERGKREVIFYNNIANHMNTLPLIPCYDAKYDEKTGRSHILLKDLTKTHFRTDYPIPPNNINCKRYIKGLAKIHAFWWDHPKLKEFSRHSVVLGIMKENSFNEKEIFKWFKNQNRDLKQFFLIQKIPFVDGISDKRKELFKTVFSLYPQLIYDRLKKKDTTLIHNDAHFWNFFYPKDIDNEKLKACLTDWATWGIGVGCQDLAFMIGIFLSPESRRPMEKDLIKRYYNNLLKFGVENYSWDECYYDYKLLALLNLFRIIDWWRRGAPPKTWWPLFENSICTIEDLNCMELLDD